MEQNLQNTVHYLVASKATKTLLALGQNLDLAQNVTPRRVGIPYIPPDTGLKLYFVFECLWSVIYSVLYLINKASWT